MKKILAFLASFTLIATSASSVVACGKTETNVSDPNKPPFNSVKLNEETRRQFALKLKQDVAKEAKGLGITEGDLWNKVNLDDWINNYIDGQLSELFTNDKVNKNLTDQLRMQPVDTNALTNNGKDFPRSDNPSVQEVNELNSRMSSLSFFTTYTAALAKRASNALDFDAKYGPLNPSEIDGKTKTVDKDGKDVPYKNIGIYFKNSDGKYTRWTSDADNTDILRDGKPISDGDVKLILGAYIPNQEQLSIPEGPDGFALVNNSTQLVLDALPTDESLLKDNLSGRQALTYRFQSYLKNEVESKNFEKILTMQYMKSQMYRFASQPANNPSAAEKAAEKALYYNAPANSDFIGKVQKWDLTANQQENFKTDLKMVWSISLDRNQKEIIEKANAHLNEEQDAASRNDKDFSTYHDNLKSLYGLDFSQKSSNVLEILQMLSDIAGGQKAETIEDTIKQVNELNKSDKGNDPIFGIKGFQGFTRTLNNNSIESVLGEELEMSNDAKTKVAKVNGSGVIKNQIGINSSKPNAFDFTFDNTKSEKRCDIILVLPIYLIDLWKQVTNHQADKDIQPTPTVASEPQKENEVLNLVTNQWVRLLPQAADAKWSGNSSSDNSKNTGTNNWKRLTETPKVTDAYPTEKTYRVLENGQIYVYLPKAEDATFSITANGQAMDINLKFTDEKPTWEAEHNFAISGVAQNGNRPMLTNGQKVSFNVHMGPDANLADQQVQRWSTVAAGYKRSDDLAYHLKANQKSELVETLMYMLALKDEEISKHAKTAVYSRYINEADIYYKPLYDRIINFIRTNEHPEESD